MSLTYTELKSRQRAERDNYSTNLGLRVHRALSWLKRAEQCDNDLDAQFIFLWISFNAAYANDMSEFKSFGEQKVFGNFLKRLCKLDSEKLLYELVWSEFTGSIRVLLDNQYVFKHFWDYQNHKISEEEWKTKFTNAKSSAHRALGKKNTALVLAIIFNRLYMLRNQLVHGGATWNGSVNRDQLRDSVNIMGKLVPITISIMMDNGSALWGEPCFPVVK